MSLPELPRQNKQKEASFGVDFRYDIEEISPPKTICFELKHTRGKDSFPFSEVKDKQIAYARKIKKGCLVRIQGVSGEPDYIWLAGVDTYVSIKYASGKSYHIEMEQFVKQKETSTKKSLSEDQAKAITSMLHV